MNYAFKYKTPLKDIFFQYQLDLNYFTTGLIILDYVWTKLYCLKINKYIKQAKCNLYILQAFTEHIEMFEKSY